MSAKELVEARLQRDLFIYGSAFVTLNGERIDPALVILKIGEEAESERIRAYREALRHG